MLVGLKHKEQAFPAQMSAGELQRIALARAIVGNRDIIVADERQETSTQNLMGNYERYLRSSRVKTILFATHNSDIVNGMRKRVFVMKEGELKRY